MCFVRIIFSVFSVPHSYLFYLLFLFLLRFLSLLHVQHSISFSVPFADFSCTAFLFEFLSPLSCFLTSFFLLFSPILLLVLF